MEIHLHYMPENENSGSELSAYVRRIRQGLGLKDVLALIHFSSHNANPNKYEHSLGATE